MTASTLVKTTDELFEQIETRISSSEDFINTDGVIQIQLTGEEEASWVIDFTEFDAKISVGENEDAECKVTLANEDFLALANGGMTPHEAFQGGKLQFEGDPGLAFAVIRMFRPRPATRN